MCRTCGFVNGVHSEHIFFHYCLHLFWASCVITEKLAEPLDQSGSVVSKSINFPMLRKGMRISSSARVGKLLYLLLFPVIPQQEEKNWKGEAGRCKGRNGRPVIAVIPEVTWAECMPLGEVMMALHKQFKKQALIGSYWTLIPKSRIWFYFFNCVFKVTHLSCINLSFNQDPNSLSSNILTKMDL